MFFRLLTVSSCFISICNPLISTTTSQERGQNFERMQETNYKTSYTSECAGHFKVDFLERVKEALNLVWISFDIDLRFYLNCLFMAS